MLKTLFIGDSILDWFNNHKYFPDIRIVNQGIAGDTIDGVLYRFAGSLKNNAFERVFIMVGHNDLIMGKPLERCIQEYTQILEIAKNNSGLKVFAIGLLPIDFVSEKLVLGFNSKLENIAKSYGYNFVEVYKYFISADRKAKEDLSDGLHLTSSGYDVLAEIFLKVFNA